MQKLEQLQLELEAAQTVATNEGGEAVVEVPVMRYITILEDAVRMQEIWELARVDSLAEEGLNLIERAATENKSFEKNGD